MQWRGWAHLSSEKEAGTQQDRGENTMGRVMWGKGRKRETGEQAGSQRPEIQNQFVECALKKTHI